MGFSSWVYIDVDQIVAETPKALLVSVGGRHVWLPRSQVADHEDYATGDRGCELAVTEFIAQQEGL